jgi:hypothetical protein
MIIYTNLIIAERYSITNPLIWHLLRICDRYKINLKTGVIETPLPENQPDKVLFWFAKSNAKTLHYYRVCEALESIYQGLVKLENHKELIK